MKLMFCFTFALAAIVYEIPIFLLDITDSISMYHHTLGYFSIQISNKTKFGNNV